MRVLFVCKANVGRSQMASAFFNRYSKKNHSLSAGTEVGGKEGLGLDESVVGCMKEEGLDLVNNKRKQLTEEMAEVADKIIVMTEEENWPFYLRDNPKVMVWEIEDAKGKDYAFHARIRDEIKEKVKKLIEEIG